VPSPGARLHLSVSAGDDDAVAVSYADPSSGRRTVRHAALAVVELTLSRTGDPDIALSTSRSAYEFGTSQELSGITLEPLPDG